MIGEQAFELREVEKLAQSQEGLVAAYRAGMLLQEKGWTMYPAAGWKRPAILAFVGKDCVAGINWSIDEDDGSADIDFAWCQPDRPMALATCLLRLRKRLRENPPARLSFTCHRGNEPMEKLVERMKLQPHSMSYRVPKGFYQRNSTQTQRVSLLTRIRNAAAAFVGASH